ncbi:hypothetical protein Q8A73_023285 [Channa argus]|nr:hypothetical protein Q8A73_023285 [Channa argus]
MAEPAGERLKRRRGCAGSSSLLWDGTYRHQALTSVFERDDLSPPCVGSTFHQEAVKQQKEVEAEATLGLLAARRGSYCCKYIQFIYSSSTVIMDRRDSRELAVKRSSSFGTRLLDCSVKDLSIDIGATVIILQVLSNISSVHRRRPSVPLDRQRLMAGQFRAYETWFRQTGCWTPVADCGDRRSQALLRSALQLRPRRPAAAARRRCIHRGGQRITSEHRRTRTQYKMIQVNS